MLLPNILLPEIIILLNENSRSKGIGFVFAGVEQTIWYLEQQQAFTNCYMISTARFCDIGYDIKIKKPGR